MPENSGSSDSLPTWLLAGLSALAIAALVWWALNRRNPKRENSSQSIQPENDSDEFNTWANDPETASPDDAKSVATRAKHMRELKAKQAAARARLDAADKADRAAQAAATSGMADKDSSLGNMDAFTSPARDATDDATSPTPRTNPISRDLASTKLPAKSTPVFQAAPIAEAHAIADTDTDADAADDIFSLPLAAAEAHHPQISANGTEAFDLDLDLDGHTNFPSNSGDQTSEDRLRRLRYMHERYPELAARTVSIDEPESVIQAARLYYEENQLGKACELLIYAVEERPQEIRFWLAQFELFRLEKMSRQFSDLADKFQLLFMHAEAWPKVVQIGYKLDSANPLFASARDLSEPETLTDGSENWLNAPVGGNVSTEHISQALVADLRTSLFAEHRVSHADFAGGPDLLNAIGERG